MSKEENNYNSIGDPSKKTVDWSKIDTIDSQVKYRAPIKNSCHHNYICDYKDTCNCSNVECWKQYFKHYKGE